MRHRVSVEVLSEQQDSFGQLIPSYTTAQTMWAYVRPIRSVEEMNSNQIRQDRTHIVTMRYFPGLVTTSRLVYNNRILNILGIVNVDERNRMYEVTCKEVTNA